jgi:hypothetical protein
MPALAIGFEAVQPDGAGSAEEKLNVPEAPGASCVVPGVEPAGGKSVLVTVGTVGGFASTANEHSGPCVVSPGSRPP